MSPEQARMWLGDGTKPPIVLPYIAQRGLGNHRSNGGQRPARHGTKGIQSTPMTQRIYIVTSGEYSDYRIEAAYTTGNITPLNSR